MLDNLFIAVLNMSLIGSYVIALVLIARLLLKKAPKIFSYALWSVVLFRLLCPFSFESVLSLMPMVKAQNPQDIIDSIAPQMNTGARIINRTINSILPTPNGGDSVNQMQVWIFIGAVIWMLGVLAMAIYSIAAFVKLRRSLVGAVQLKENIYLADPISAPFVMGLLKPKIYLPSSLSSSEKDFITLHEMCHIRRFDHVTRILGFAALAVHWFNPLVWIAFVVSGKDMELSCDEAVMKKMKMDIRAEYSQSLLRFGAVKRMIHATPLAFGEGDTKNRIKNVLNYKKPAFWVIVVSMMAVVAIGIGLAVNPMEKRMGEPSGVAGVNAIILEIDAEGQTMLVEGIDRNSAIGDNCILDWSNANLQTVEADGSLKTLLMSDFSAGDSVVLFIDEIQETDPIRAKASTIQLQNETLLSGTYSAEELCNAATPYIGNNAAVGKLIGLLPTPMGLRYDHFELQTSAQPYRIEIVYSMSTKMLAKYDSVDGAVADSFQKNALLLLALVDNADEVRAVLTDGNREVGLINGREWAEYITGGDVRDYAQSPEKLQELIDFTVTGSEDKTAGAEYSFAKIGKNGEMLSGYSLKSKELADAILFDALSKSAACEGVDVSTLEECYLIRKTLPETGETHDYYAYRFKEATATLPSGTAVLQDGAQGRYSVLSEELYAQLVDSFDARSIEIPYNASHETVDKKVAQKMQMQRRLETTIVAIDGVKSCSVVIADALDAKKSSVTVTLEMEEKQEQNDKVKAGIKALVKNSIDNLSEDDITIRTL